MRNSMKYLVAMILGGVFVGSILFAVSAAAQNEAADMSDADGQPSVIDSTLLWDVNNVFQYQGQLLSSGDVPINGVVPMQFRLYDSADATTALWQENTSVSVTDGWFTQALGAQPGNGISDEFLNGRNLWLGVAVANDAEMSPRQPIRPTIYAVNSHLLDGNPSSNFLEARRGPIAYGVVKSSGGRESGWHFTSEHISSKSRYEIRLEVNNAFLPYNFKTFTTVVTPLEGSNCPGATVATTNQTDDGLLIVYLHHLDGNYRQCDFSFITIENKPGS